MVVLGPFLKELFYTFKLVLNYIILNIHIKKFV